MARSFKVEAGRWDYDPGVAATGMTPSGPNLKKKRKKIGFGAILKQRRKKKK